MTNEKRNWQTEVLTMLDTLAKLPQITDVPVLGLEPEMRQVAMVEPGMAQGQGSYGEAHGGVTMVSGAETMAGTTESRRSAYQEVRAIRRQSEKLLQI